MPHALLRQPERTGVYRFVYPTLLVAGVNALFMWDVRTGIMTERIQGTQTASVVLNQPRATGSNTSFNPHSHDTLGEINYVEVNEKYALVCGSEALRVFRRHSRLEGNEATRNHTADCVLEIPRSQSLKSGRWRFDVKYVKREELPDDFKPWQERRGRRKQWKWARDDKVVVKHSVTMSNGNRNTPPFGPGFLAAHFSTCGQHMAGLLDYSQLVIIPYFERVVKGEVKSVHDIKIDIGLHTPLDSTHLAYEDGRIGVVTGLAVFIVHPTFPDPSDLETPPSIEVVRVTGLGLPFMMRQVECVQLTPTALWFSWEDPMMSDTVPEEREELLLEQLYGGHVAARRSLGTPDVGGINSCVFSVDFSLGSG